MKKNKNEITVNDFMCAKSILNMTLILYKKAKLYESLAKNISIKTKIKELSYNFLEQFEQMMNVLEVQDNA